MRHIGAVSDGTSGRSETGAKIISHTGKLSCARTVLKRCTKIEILWYRKLDSRDSPEKKHLFSVTLPASENNENNRYCCNSTATSGSLKA